MGRRLQQKLAARGHKVTVVSRSPSGDSQVSWKQLEAEGLPADTGAVVNLAGRLIMDFKKPWSDAYRQECISSRVDTTRLLARLVSEAKAPPSVFVATSAVGYYPPYPAGVDKTYTEDFTGTSLRDGFAANLCVQIEKAAELSDGAAANTRAVTMRPGVVLGKGGGAFGEMRLPFKFGVGGPFGDGKQWFPWVHLDDVADMYVWAVENADVAGPVNAVAPNPVTNGAFVTTLASAMWRPCLFSVPAFVLNLAGKDRASMLLEGQKVLPKRAVDLGFEFSYPSIADCCKELVS